MQIKAFVIRLDSAHFKDDQDRVNSFLETVKFKKSAVSFVEGEPHFWAVLVHYEEISQSGKELGKSRTSADKKPAPSRADLNPEELELANQLKKWRLKQAEIESLPAFMILSNADIYNVARARPQSVEDLIELKGFGEKKISRYGDDIIALLNSI